MRILRAETYRRTPWKNGGGETAEIAVYPADSDFETFGWRVSMATVASDGPFSVFHGIDRTLSVLEGDGIVLDIEGWDPVTLTAASGPLSFPADARTSAGLVGGPIIDLNVMTRRGRYAHNVTRHEVEGMLELAAGTGQAVLFCAAADLRVSGRGFQAHLHRYDAVMPVQAKRVRVEGRGPLFRIDLNSVE